MKMKVEFMATLATQLPSNSTLFFLDVDVIVFRPLSELLSWVYADSFTFMWENNHTVNTGFYALRSGPTSIAMLDTWRKRSIGPKGKGENDQTQMNAYLRENPQLKNTFPRDVATTHMGNIFSFTVAYHSVGASPNGKLALLATAATEEPRRQADSESYVMPGGYFPPTY